MNILYITQWFSSKGGGGEVVFINLANGMIKKGHQVDVISHKLNDNNDEQINGLKIHRIRPMLDNQLPTILDNFLFMICGTILGLKIIRRNKIDIIHSNNFMSVVVGRVLSKIFNIPFVTTIHNVYYQTPKLWDNWSQQKGVSKFSKILGPKFEKTTIKFNADVIHTVSKATYDDVVKINRKSKIVLITNGIYPEKYQKYYSQEFKDHVVFIGRLVYYKNIKFLINCFHHVVEKVPEAKLIIIGEGPMREELNELVLQKQLQKNIIFIGFNDGYKKFNLIAESTALLQPSLSEGSSMVAMEAFALGKPVIMSNLRVSDELIINGINGFTLPPDDQKQWVEKIVMLLKDKSLSRYLGKNAQIRMNEKFNLNLLLQEFELLYIELLNKRKKNNH